MPTPSEHKTVQARILEYAKTIGWTIVSQEEAERRRGFDPEVPLKERAKGRSLFFDELLDTKVREFNPRYCETKEVLPGHFGTREDVVFFVNGIPVLVIECKNATKDEAIALGVPESWQALEKFDEGPRGGLRTTGKSPEGAEPPA